MYYKFSGFTQNLVGAGASHAYSPQVGRRGAGSAGRGPEPLRQAAAARAGEAPRAPVSLARSSRRLSAPAGGATDVPSSVGVPPAELAGQEAGAGTRQGSR